MKFYKTLSVFLLGTVLFSCIEHEVIPPPKEEVELNSSFSATLEGSQYELIQDVNGYYCEPTQAKEILPTPQLSTVTYYSAMKSNAALDFIQIGIGKLNFNADSSIDPSVEQFTTFFNSNTNPPYSFEAENGVEVVFRDGSGNVWRSYQDSGAPQDFTFTSLVQESDEEGDYMKFVANFSLELYDDIDNPTDTILMENAVFEGYFKK
ncbi:MAG: hypothetical protein COA32_02850 [Fluviicola sp.]|nr:MAG: hypothetical protein COA32_02850 [Fluviicola sp.]